MKHLLMTLAILILASALLAHPAGTVSAKYDANTKLLSVTFDHGVKDPADHFIKSIVVKVNGTTAITQNIGIQESPAGGSFAYKLLNIKKGDVIEVATDCSKGGKKSSKLTIK